MKRNIILFISILLIIGCNKSINITPPTIIVKSGNLVANSQISIEVIQSADIDGNAISPDYYHWSIKDNYEDTVFFNDTVKSVIKWIPLTSGSYIISVKIGYDGNKSITAIKQIEIIDSPESFVHRLAGNWSGSADAMFGFKWDVDLTIDSTGHYYGKAYNLSDSNYPARIFYGGDYKENGFQSDKIVITSILDSTIEGYVLVTYNNLVTNKLNIIKLNLKNNDSELLIWLTNFDGETYGAEYYTEHKLGRK